MSRLQRSAAIGVAVALLILASTSWAQEGVSATLDPSGLIRLSRGGTALAEIELNAHGPDWKHAPQVSATVQVSALPDGNGEQVVGTLPIPNTTDGSLQFTERVKPIPQGLQLEYDLSPKTTMRLNGLQLSIILPIAAYGGQEVVASSLEGEPTVVGLPVENKKQGSQLWSGEGAKIEAAKGAEGAFVVEMRAPTDVMVQDLRQWDQQVYEIRFPAIMEDQGREVTTEDKFHLDLTITFPEPVKLASP